VGGGGVSWCTRRALWGGGGFTRRARHPRTHLLVYPEHHHVQGPIHALGGCAVHVVRHKHEPVVARYGPHQKRRALREQLLQVRYLLLGPAVRVLLRGGELKVLARVRHPLHAKRQALRELQKPRKAHQQRGGAARLEHQLPRVHKKGGLGQHVRIHVAAGQPGQNGALCVGEHRVPVRTRDVAQPVGLAQPRRKVDF